MSVHCSLCCSWTCLSIAACAAPGRVCSAADRYCPWTCSFSTAQHQLALCIDMGKTTFEVRRNNLLRYLGCFVFLPHNSVPFQASEWLFCGPGNSLRMINFFRGITESIPSLFRRIFSEQNSVANPNTSPGSCGASAPISTFMWIHVSDLYIPRIGPRIS